MSYRTDKQVIDTHTYGHTERHTDAGDDYTRRPKLASGKKVRQTDGQMENTICRAGWSQLKTIGHLFYATSSFMHHFITIGEFKLESQSGNAQFGSNLTIFRA